jgi:hypothetical protein
MATKKSAARAAVDPASRPSARGAQPVSSPNEDAKRAGAPGPDANDANAQADAANDGLPTIVRVSASRPALVTVERIADRERMPNGATPLEPNVERSFIVDDGQSLRITEA